MTSVSVQTQPKETTQKVDGLNALAWELRRTDTKRALILSAEALHRAQAAGYERGQAYSALVSGYGAMRSSDLQTALDKLQAALEFFERSDDKEGSHQALNTLGIIYAQAGNYAGGT